MNCTQFSTRLLRAVATDLKFAPHALVMTLLFKSDLSAPHKLRTILKLAVATNLAAFATVYSFFIFSKLVGTGAIIE